MRTILKWNRVRSPAIEGITRIFTLRIQLCIALGLLLVNCAGPERHTRPQEPHDEKEIETKASGRAASRDYVVSDAFRQAFLAYGNCVKAHAVRYSVQAESADILAQAAVAKCGRHRTKVNKIVEQSFEEQLSDTPIHMRTEGVKDVMLSVDETIYKVGMTTVVEQRAR